VIAGREILMPLTCRGPRAAVAPTPKAARRRQPRQAAAAADSHSLTAGQSLAPTSVRHRRGIKPREGATPVHQHQVPRRAGQAKRRGDAPRCPALPCPRRASDSVTAAALSCWAETACSAPEPDAGRVGRGPSARGPRGAFGIFADAGCGGHCRTGCAVLPVDWRHCRCAGCRHLKFGTSLCRPPRFAFLGFGSVRCWCWNETERGGWVPWTVLSFGGAGKR
jgi:hypothetical protein